jgi:hypothetical protein
MRRRGRRETTNEAAAMIMNILENTPFWVWLAPN